MKQSKNAAIGGVLVALSVILLYLSCITPVLKIGLCAVSGIFPAFQMQNRHFKNAFLIYVTVCILTFILLSDKLIFSLYFLFFGLYPFIKYGIESKIPRKLQWLCKILFCNLMLLFYKKMFLLLFSDHLTRINNVIQDYPWYFILLIINCIFIFYDLVFSKVLFYVRTRIQL